MQTLFRDTIKARKFADLAIALQPLIDAKLHRRLENTPKRAREAGNARNEGNHLARTQKAARIIATLLEQGQCPAILYRIKPTRAEVYELMRSKIEHNGGYYDAGRDTGKPYSDNPAAIMLWALIGGQNVAELKAQELAAALAKVKFANIAGYFPTPEPVVYRMIERAQITNAHHVLEPSAGSGNIADAIKEEAPNCALWCCEISPSLANILTLKGYSPLQGDFMEEFQPESFDRILMNPPFEIAQDIAHVRRAYDLLKHGGRLVAIMSPSFQYNSASKFENFRRWLHEVEGEVEPIPAGAFHESGTDIATVLVEIRKP